MLRPSSLSPGVPALLVRTPPSSPPLFDTQDLIALQSEKVLSVTFIDSIKNTTLHLLNTVVYKYWEEICYSCYINHPSQKHHDCVWGIPDDFYESKFELLTESLWTDRFIPAIQSFLITKGIFAHEARIQGAAEAILHELKAVGSITNQTTNNGNDCIKTGQLHVIHDFCKGEDH